MRERINKKKRTPKRIILAICEGETEAAYIELLKRHYRLPVVIKSKIAGNKISQRLVSQYVNELGLSKKDDCIVFFIYDMDIQDIIVYVIIACVFAVIIRYVYRQLTGKNKGCNCDSCPKHGGDCHCHDTQK